MNRVILRGQIYRVNVGFGLKPWLIVSNNRRNRQLATVLAVRCTTTDNAGIPTAVRLTTGDPIVGYVLADDLVQLYVEDDLANAEYLGSLSPSTIPRVNSALRLALALP